MLLTYIYLIVEFVNSIYVLKFGLKFIEKQPPSYIRVRKYLIYARLITAIAASLYFLYRAEFILAIIVFVLPTVMNKLLFFYCQRRQVKWLMGLYMDKERNGEDAMTRKDAKRVAMGIVNDDIKAGVLLF